MSAPRVNLLPHREQKRQARQRQFVSLAVSLAVLGLAIVGNPFANMAVSDRIRPRQLAIDAPLLLIACGLAMRGFD